MTIKAFEERCGMSNGYISSMRKGLGANKLNNVLTQFPELNREWLLYGEGTMLRVDATASTEEEEIAMKTDMYKAMTEELTRLRKELEETKEDNERLKKVVDRLLDNDNSISKCKG